MVCRTFSNYELPRKNIDEKLKFWRLDTLPFIPSDWKYEIIPQVENQFNIVKGLMQREDIEEIYNAGDSGREGEYIQRLVFMMAHPNPNAKNEKEYGLIHKQKKKF